MFDSVKALFGKVEKGFEDIKEKSNASIETLRSGSNQLVSNMKTEFDGLTEKSKDVFDKFSSSIPFVSIAAVRAHDVDLSAGKELVDSYTKSLGAIHRNGLINAEKARLSFRTLTACATHCATIESEWNSLVAQFEELPSVSNNIININKRITAACDAINIIEAALTEEMEKTVSQQIKLFKQSQSAKLEAYRQKKEDEIKSLEVTMKKMYEVTTTSRREKALSKSVTLEQSQDQEHERVRAELDKKIQKEMQDFIVYGSFGAKPKSLANSLEEIPAGLNLVPTSTSGKSELEEFLGAISQEETEEEASKPAAHVVLADEDEPTELLQESKESKQE